MDMIPQLPRPEREYNWQDKIFTQDNVLTPEECAELIEWAKGPNSGLHKGIPRHNYWKSSFHTTQLVDTKLHEKLQPLWHSIIDHFKFDIDFIEEYELKCYGPGDFFDAHTDLNYSLTNNLERKITLSINLSDPSEYEGGKFTNMGLVMNTTQGSCSAFPSFFRHQIYEVTQGERWSMIGWAWGPYWR